MAAHGNGLFRRVGRIHEPKEQPSGRVNPFPDAPIRDLHLLARGMAGENPFHNVFLSLRVKVMDVRAGYLLDFVDVHQFLNIHSGPP